MEIIKISDLSLWEAFYTVAKKQSFTKAANSLNMSLAVLSKKIKKLEDELQVRLLTRTTRTVRLTQEGVGIFPLVENTLENARGLESHLESKTQTSGLIRLTCLPAFAERRLAPLIIKFQREYPDVSFEVHSSDQIIDLIDSQMDLAIRVQEPKGAQYVFRKLVINQGVLCASPQFMRGRQIKRIEDLKGLPVLILPQYEEVHFLNTKTSLSELSGRQTILTQSGAFLTSLALAGAGIVVRSLWDVESLILDGKLVRVLEKYPLEPFGALYAVTPHRKLILNRLRLFLDFLAREVGSISAD